MSVLVSGSKKLTTRNIRVFKKATQSKPLSMLTCYDFQTAQLLNESALDTILVGDSLGNVVLGLEDTLGVTVEHMCLFGKAVRKGAPNKFLVVDMPFGSTTYLEKGLDAAEKIMRETGCDSVKIEGASEHILKLITRLTQSGIPVVGHIGLVPQSVHELGGYYKHGKDQVSADILLEQAIKLEKAGCFSIVLEVIEETTAKKISESLQIPTIGIGSGPACDGQVLVINDLLKNGPGRTPSFVKPVANLFDLKKDLLDQYLKNLKFENESRPLHN